MREFADFWATERQQYTCCLAASDEDLAVEPDLYDCDTCPVSMALDTLWPENIDAWEIFQSVVTRFGIDTHTTPLALEAHLADRPFPERRATLSRLAILYDALYPPQTGDGRGA